jgi:hypothetical protein
MTSRQIEILEIFSEVANDYADRQVFKMREGYVPVVKHDIAKRAWREANLAKQRVYVARSKARKNGKPLPPLVREKAELFWDGDGWYIAKPRQSERLGGPFTALHEAWKQADLNKLEVVSVSTTRGERSYRV